MEACLLCVRRSHGCVRMCKWTGLPRAAPSATPVSSHALVTCTPWPCSVYACDLLTHGGASTRRLPVACGGPMSQCTSSRLEATDDYGDAATRVMHARNKDRICFIERAEELVGKGTLAPAQTASAFAQTRRLLLLFLESAPISHGDARLAQRSCTALIQSGAQSDGASSSQPLCRCVSCPLSCSCRYLQSNGPMARSAQSCATPWWRPPERVDAFVVPGLTFLDSGVPLNCILCI